MKTFIIAAMTADGFIGRNEGHLTTTWTSRADKKFFTQRTKEAHAALFGRNTYETFKRALPGRRTVVYTTHPEDITAENVETVAGSPQDVIDQMQANGVSELAICGGAQVYAAFLRADLVNEIYITVHPIVFGSGVPLFREPLERRLALIDTRNIGDETVLLHYSVIKD